MQLTKNGWYRTRGGDRVFVFKAFNDDFPWMIIPCGKTIYRVTNYGNYSLHNDNDRDVLSDEPPECDCFHWVPPEKLDWELFRDAIRSHRPEEYGAMAEHFLKAIKERDK
jgi:hypothetical protein